MTGSASLVADNKGLKHGKDQRDGPRRLEGVGGEPPASGAGTVLAAAAVALASASIARWSMKAAEAFVSVTNCGREAAKASALLEKSAGASDLTGGVGSGVICGAAIR